MSKLTPAQVLLARHLRELKLRPEFEVRVCPERRFRFDIALPEQRIGIEIEGAVWTCGRHTRGAGYIKDLEKYNLATVLGWRVFRWTPQQVLKGEAKEFLKAWLVSSHM